MTAPNDSGTRPPEGTGGSLHPAAAVEGGTQPQTDDQAAAALEFPEVARLELDFLLQELRDRAGDVLAVQGRLRGLLKANAAVTSELSLPVVLQRVAEAARHLLNARYAALGVIGRDGQLEQFLHTGMPPAEVQSIGHLPHGDGVLGLLTREAVPIRLFDLASHPSSSGFPPGHPPMHSFLGVPIRAGGVMFGNLYVTERADGGQFSAEDEQLAAALAVTAGGAIANARLFADSEQRQRWLVASASLTTQLLALGAEQPLALIAQQALTAAEADFAHLVVPSGAAELMVAATAGSATDKRRIVPLHGSLPGQVMQSGLASRVASHSEGRTDDPTHSGGPLLVAPLIAGERTRGVLVLGRFGGRAVFTEIDLTMAAAFTRQAALALELAESRVAQTELARMQDRDRIAADMHDHVIQQLFAIGMGLQGLASITQESGHLARLQEYIDELDGTISSIRTTIFQLRSSRGAGDDLRAQILDIAAQHTAQLGFSPDVVFGGPLNSGLSEILGGDVLAVIREATSNCARHAGATRLKISIRLIGERLTVEVTDDGQGIGTPSRLSGLTNLRRRAENHQGTLSITTPERGGTHLTWTVTTGDATVDAGLTST